MNNFKLRLDSSYSYKKGDILETGDGVKVLVTSPPKEKYKKWYYRLLNKLTFNIFFNYESSYSVKLIENG